MTDEDRYGKQLGKGFVGVRGALCSEGIEAEAPARAAASYILSVFEKDFELKPAFLQVAAAIDGFPDAATLESIERASTESLGAQHFAQAVREVRDTGERAACVLDRLAVLGVEVTEARIQIERDYKGDIECQRAFARHRGEIKRDLVEAMRRKCGLPAAFATKAVADQEALLDFVVVRE